MKKLLVLLSLLGMVGITRGGERFAEKNGDVNADGAIDISDAMVMLGHLFLGSPGQLPGLRRTPGLSALPDTGQTTCYDTAGNVIECESDGWPGQDGFYATGCPSEGRFVDNGDGTVTDTCTGLVWQKDTADINGDGAVTPPPIGALVSDYGPDGATWQQALRYCEELEFAGHRDWRLPNARELNTIVDYQRDEPFPSIDPAFEAESAYYWTSTSLLLTPQLAVVIPFYTCGEMYHASKAEDTRFVRAVRAAGCVEENGDVNADGAVNISDVMTLLGHLFLGAPRRLPLPCGTQSELPDTGQTMCYDTAGDVIDCESDAWPGQDGFHATGCPSEGRFIDNGDGTVTDTCTGLMWQRETADVDGDPDGAPWQDALRYCEDLELAGHRDWRLPNARELESLVDYGRVDPCIDPVFEAEPWRYWTSTTLVGLSLATGGSEAAVFVAFPYPGRIYNSDKGSRRLVRAVRDMP